MIAEGRGLGMAAGKRGVAEAGAEPVGRFGWVHVGIFFGANVIEGGDGERIDGRGRKERVAAALNGNDADPAFAAARNRRGEHAHVARAVVAQEAEKDVVGKRGTDDLLVAPLALVEIEVVEFYVLGDGALGIGSLKAIILGHLVHCEKRYRMRAVRIETVGEVRLEAYRGGDGLFLGRVRVGGHFCGGLAPHRSAESGWKYDSEREFVEGRPIHAAIRLAFCTWTERLKRSTKRRRAA